MCVRAYVLYSFTHLYGAHQVFGVIAGEKFSVDIDNGAIRYYSGIFFSFHFILFIQVLVIWSLCLCV